MPIFKSIFAILVMLICAVSSASAQDKREIVRIAAIDWCPQLCPNSKDRGYVYDLVQKAFEDSPYELLIETMPWSRAIKMTQDGIALALLSPAKAEAPDLLYPDIAVGAQSMCFFTRTDNTWNYMGEQSLKGLRIGIANDTSIEELNQYVQENRDQFQFQPYSDKYIVSSLRKLEHDRIDTFLFTKNTTLYEIDKIGWSDRFRLAGCVTKADIFMAFSPNAKVQERVRPVMNYFQTRLKMLIEQGEYVRILAKYGIEI